MLFICYVRNFYIIDKVNNYNKFTINILSIKTFYYLLIDEMFKKTYKFYCKILIIKRVH